MHPILFDLGFYKIRFYGLMLALGFLAALIFCRFESKRIRVKPMLMSDLLIWTLIGGIVGARLLYMIIFLGGVTGAYLFARSKKISFIDLADLATPALMLGQALGRWGCFMAGCCYGKVVDADFPLGVAYPVDPDSLIPPALQNPDMAHPTHFLHPSQLYLSANGLILWLILWFLLRRRTCRGQVTGAFLILYAATRSFFGIFRGDAAERVFYGPLSTSQWVSVPVMLIGIYLLATCRKRPAPPWKEEAESRKG